jgi:DNA-binding transcriptional regulator YhcF (GntR family)
MVQPKKLIINVETGEEQYLDLTDEEIAQAERDKIEWEQKDAERQAFETATAEAKASATAKLAALGLTAEEIAALTK